MPLVTVIIPTYNYAHFLPEAIQSVLSQTFTDYEIIVVDDGSTDNTRSVVAQFDERVRYVYQENSGPNVARNAGIRESQGRYIAFLDADDKWLPDKLTLQVPLLEANQLVGLVYAGMYLFDSETDAVIGYHPLERCQRGQVLRQLYLDQFVPAPTPVVRREVFDSVGSFDEHRVTSDDWDLWLRIASVYWFDFVPKPLALYRVHPSVHSTIFSDYEVREREMLAFFMAMAERYRTELGDLRNLRLSTYEEDLGWRLIQRGNRDAGRRRILQAIHWFPFRLRPYALLAASFLPRGSSPESYRLSRLEYALGKQSLFDIKLKEARRHFLLAIRTHPWQNAKAYMGLLLSLTGRRFVHWVRQRHGVEFYCNSPAISRNLTFEQW